MIVTLTGPSCGGKTTLENALKECGFATAVATTTRPKRAGEIDGQSYYFLTREEFERDRDAGAFVESAEFNDCYYGKSRKEIERVLATGKPVVLVIEPIGLAQLQACARNERWDVFSIFIDNPPAVLAERFLRRFAKEVVLPSKDELDKAVDVYASRMVQMMTTERNWSDLANMRETKIVYDAVFGEFNESNISAIVNMLVSMAARKERNAA